MKLRNLLPTRNYACNAIVNRIPLEPVRMTAYRRLGAQIGEGSTIMMNTTIVAPQSLKIGRSSIINPFCYLDCRAGLTIGNTVNISSHALLVEGTHDLNDERSFYGTVAPIRIDDYAWLGVRCVVLSGVIIGRGAVVAAGAVVIKNVEPFSVVGGVPARVIGERPRNLSYGLEQNQSWQ